jgi:hypothetical protein
MIQEKAQAMNSEITLKNNYLTVKTTTVVSMSEFFVITSDDGPVDLTVNITCDLENVPEKYREVAFNVLTSKYLNTVSFGNNPFSDCKPVVKRKWYQFWKTKYFQQL